MSWIRKATAPEVTLTIVKAQGKIEDLSKALNAMVDSGKITQQEISILNDQMWEVSNMLDSAIAHLQPQQDSGYHPITEGAD